MAGVAALVAINSFTDNLRTSVAEQAQEILGADLSLSAPGKMDTISVVTALMDSLLRVAPEIASASSASFTSMAYLDRTETARLVQVRTIDPGYPYYGDVVTEPTSAWDAVQQGGAVVDPSLLATLDAAVGDTLLIGNGRFPIVGTVTNVPGQVGLQSAFGSRVFIATNQVATTGLLLFGARVEWEVHLKLPNSIDAQAVADRARAKLREARVRIRTVADDRDDLTQGLTRLGNYLGLVALAALLLGGLGTASAVHVLIRQRQDTIAMLRCLGATSRQVIAIHLLQALGLGLIGSTLGAILGVIIQQVLPFVLADFLPVNVRVLPSAEAIALGIGLGLWTAAMFALLPLLGIRAISPLATLRRESGAPTVRWDAWRGMALLALAVSVVLLAAIQVGSFRHGFWFAVAAGVALLVLWLSSMTVIWLARQLAPKRGGYLFRQGLANLHRPGNQTVSVVLSLGLGAFLLATLYTAQINLLQGFQVDDGGTGRSNLVLFDIQSDQVARVSDALRAESVTPGEFTPLVPMRLAQVGNRRVNQLLRSAGEPDSLAESDVQSPIWALRREYRSTYRYAAGPSEKVVSGSWFSSDTTASGRTEADPVSISVEVGLAEELAVGLGDRIVWDVQGQEVHSVITSLREVNWARFEPNFFVVFAPGALEAAPQMWVTLARIPDPMARGRVQRALAEQAPNVTTVDLGELQQALESVISRVVIAIRFMALFSLATGAVVLVGAIITSRWQRMREGTLLRTLGATRSQVLKILGVEYAALGLAAALVASVLAAGAGWALAHWVFDASFAVPWMPLVTLAGGLVALTTGVGLWASYGLLDRPPLEVLRGD
jgi:putative ABC transport system permease protein